MKIIKNYHICLFCGKEETLKYDEYITYFECDCKDAIEDRRILFEIEKLKKLRPKQKYEIITKDVLIKK
jgi:hypothetical protein